MKMQSSSMKNLMWNMDSVDIFLSFKQDNQKQQLMG